MPNVSVETEIGHDQKAAWCPAGSIFVTGVRNRGSPKLGLAEEPQKTAPRHGHSGRPEPFAFLSSSIADTHVHGLSGCRPYDLALRRNDTLV